jgi:topoisomerase-4 subunit A
MELKKEHETLSAERGRLMRLLDDANLRRKALSDEVKAARKQHADPRRTILEDLPVIEAERLEVPVERLPMTVVLSQQNWIRSIDGHQVARDEIRYKEGDEARFVIEALSTDKLLVWMEDGKVFTIPIDRLPGGRGTGEPLSLLADVPKGGRVIDATILRPGARLALATRAGRGFVTEEASAAASTRAGRQVVDLDPNDRLVRVCPVTGDHLAVLGSHRRLLVFPIDQLKVIGRGKGVQLMKLSSAEIADIASIDGAKGFVWQQGSRQRREEIAAWLGDRASSGRNTPVGFPKDLAFTRTPIDRI